MKILFKYTTRSRRTNFHRGLDSIVNNLNDKDNYHVLISIDSDDKTMEPIPVLNCNHTYMIDDSKSKVDAINRDINEFTYDWDILVNFSDDQIFTKRGFDDTIREQFYKSPDQFIHFPDGFTGDRLATMSIMDRKYYNRFNYIYHPDYKSLWCDNEAMEVAKILGCYSYVDQDIFKHLHPVWIGNHADDAQYRHTESYHPVDNATYLRRKQNNFDL